MPINLEVCVDSLESVEKVIDIVQQGQNRFEVCSNLIHGGGLTPSIGLINAILSRYPGVRLMAMIRPRIGSFVYTEAEVEVMEQDILSFKAVGVTGVVFGCLTKGGDVDVTSCQRLATAAHPLEITFHRAIDLIEPLLTKSLDDIARVSGITRILSSGQEATVSHGLPCLVQLHKKCYSLGKATRRRCTLILGSGVNALLVERIRQQPWAPHAIELHMTGGSAVEERLGPLMKGRGEVLGFGEDRKWVLDRAKVQAVWDEVKDWTWPVV